MAGLAEQAECLQAAAQLGSFLPVLLRQPVAEGAVGVTELESGDHFGMVDPPGAQVSECLG
jgi:hypothetical protein